MPIPRAPESHTVDPDFDDVTVADLVNANPILAFYLTKEPAMPTNWDGPEYTFTLPGEG